MVDGFKSANYNEELPNIVTGLEKKVGSRAASVLRQPIRNLETTIQVLDENDTIIDTITGRAIGGTISYNATSLIRRTGTIDLVVDPAYMPSKKSVVWFDKKFRVYQGVIDLTRFPRESINFLLGTFWIDSNSLSYDNQSQRLHLELSDKMTKYESLGLETKLELKRGIPMSTAIRKLMEDEAMETAFGEIQVSEDDEILPYDYKKEAGTSLTDIIQDFRDMYMDYICGYDIMGRFEYRRIEMQKRDKTRDPKWEFDSTMQDRGDLTLSFSESYDLKEVKNRIVVIGSTSTITGYTPKGSAMIVDPENQFNIDAIGTHTKIIQNSDSTNDLRCISQARYELWKTSHFQETVSLEVVPVYLLQPNDLIVVTNPVTGKSARYMIDSISLDLSVEGTMSIEAHKMYYVNEITEFGDSPIVQAIKNGINNLGWLSLAEQRIKDTYGIQADGGHTLRIRFVLGQPGGEQAAVSAYVTTETQTFEIDLADFSQLKTGDPNGDTGRSKADYSDRVFAHEMFHAVCNDLYSAPQTMEMPSWFKEGFAELLIGGKDRYMSITGFADANQKKKYFIERARGILVEGKGINASEDYVASYLIAATIYYILGSKQKLQAMFQSIENIGNKNLNFLYKILPEYGDASSIAGFVLNKMDQIPLWQYLNDRNDPDTCSIGGIHMLNLYGKALDADSVFNEDEAKTDSIGFKIQFDD